MKRWIALIPALMIMLFSDCVMEAVRSAAAVFFKSVMPALFPMMVLCALMENFSGNAGTTWGKTVETILFCFLSGSPASARRVNGIVKNDEHFARNALPLMGICGVVSPLFFLGMLQSRLPKGFGLILLLCHWLGALITGGAALLWERWISPSKETGTAALSTKTPSQSGSLLSALPGAILTATQSLLSVLGAMMLMGAGAALLRQLLTAILPVHWQSPRLFALIFALMEIGGGCHALLDSMPLPELPLLCGLCSFGGLSIWMQCLMFLGNEIHPGKLLLLRLFHGAVGYGICYACMRFFPAVETAAAFSAMGGIGRVNLLPLTALLLPLLPGLLGLLRPCPGRSRIYSQRN